MRWTQAFLSSLILLARSASALDITTCAIPGGGTGPAQTVPAKQTAVLQTDLTGCHYAVALENGATLQMNNHKISDCGVYAIVCLGRRCTVRGPGEITGAACNLTGDPAGGGLQKMVVRDVDVHDTWGIVGGVRTRLSATNVTVTRQIDQPGAGGGSQVAVFGYSVVGNNLVVTDNIGFGISAYRRLLLRDSTITGNNGRELGFDIISDRRPRLFNTTCGRSLDTHPPFGSWGVCQNDSPSGAFLDEQP